MVALQISPKIESLYGLGQDYPWDYPGCQRVFFFFRGLKISGSQGRSGQATKGLLYGILQDSHLNNFPLKTLKLGWIAFHSVAFQLKCLDFQSNQYKKLVPVLLRFYNESFSKQPLV